MLSVESLPDTPVMRQYQELKKGRPDAILFFRLGDFYEMFGEDAKLAAPLLGLVLTARQEVPMCGVPYHNSQNYIGKLLRAGHKVAIADQVEEPSKEKKLVRREVTRLITPGTIIEENLLEPAASNYLVAVSLDIVGWGAACVDVSTGEFWATEALNDRGQRRLLDLLARVSPAELLLSEAAMKGLPWKSTLPRACLTRYEPDPRGELRSSWRDSPPWPNRPLATRAALMVERYVAGTQFHLKELLKPAYRESGSEMQLDETAIRTLELVESSTGERRHTLWGLLDLCRTPMGSRHLRHWILHPSTEIRDIEQRQNCVEDLLNKPEARRSLRALLDEFADLPRVISRLGTRQAGPRDLGALRRSLEALEALARWLAASDFCPGLSGLSGPLQDTVQNLADLSRTLSLALRDELPARISDGYFIKSGYHAQLEELRALKSDGQGFLARLEAEERQATGINSLKAGYNSVFGYYFEVSKANQDKVPARFSRKQTLTNAERYITPELKELENKILGAEEKMLRLEARLFEDLREQALRKHEAVLTAAKSISELDVFQSLAEAASRFDWAKPVVDLSHDLRITEGRHPVLSAWLPAGSFVPNSIELEADNAQVMILTGPNMSGKSTFLRQNALIALMAQIGSFVPARSAKIGLVDRILTRIGAQDTLARGESTFMVEMKETSYILRSATTRSLLILDEVGRGTSTFDGISIAWAVLEHLNAAYAATPGPRGPRVLFATHYLELTELARSLAGVVNFNIEAKEWTAADGKTEVVFLHRIAPGPADRSYGIHVAALAGLPAPVLARSREILAKLENESASGSLMGRGSREPELPLFPKELSHPVLESLRLLDPQNMTPLEALSALSELRKKI
ncbi:MAG: DNA mismatch repair protein MutS [Elusimicrobia bacterium]|nr:DNA mismatch repair protein MutS [Elusimicrobiota bacterium]